MSIKSFIAINTFFIAVNAVAAGIMIGIGVIARSFIPESDDSWFVWFVIGLCSVAGSVALAMWSINFTARRRRRNPARARG